MLQDHRGGFPIIRSPETVRLPVAVRQFVQPPVRRNPSIVVINSDGDSPAQSPTINTRSRARLLETRPNPTEPEHGVTNSRKR